MAIITSDKFLDDGTARTAGEAWSILENARLTIRTDTRWHVGSPASMTGSLGSQTITEGEILIDGRNVRWMPFDSGTGNVPAIGTTVTQGGVSGYLLGVWATVLSAPTAVAAAMPTSGFIKFREVSGGTFSLGALTGIGASATGPDVTGWIEVVADVASNITVPRLGRYRIYGDKFFLSDTTGVIGQAIPFPCNGSLQTLGYGLFVETAVGSDSYEFWPAITESNGWLKQHIGMPPEEVDIRQKFVKVNGSTGTMVFGETRTALLTGTYTATASTTGTYVEASNPANYWVYGTDKIYVQCTSGHQYSVGNQVGIQFTSGGMFTPVNRTAIFTITEVPSTTAFIIDFVGAAGITVLAL